MFKRWHPQRDKARGNTAQVPVQKEGKDSPSRASRPILSSASYRSSHRKQIERAIESDELMAEAVRKQLEALQSEYTKLNQGIWKKRYSLTSVGMLPTEILGEVFEQAVFETERKHDMAALKLSHVCKAWRKVIHSTPRAWATIPIRLSRPHAAALAELYFNLARACPLHVLISDPPDEWKYEPPTEKLLPFTELLRTHWRHIRIFRMYRMGGQVASNLLQGCNQVWEPETPEFLDDSYGSVASSPTPSHDTEVVARHIALNLIPNHTANRAPDVADFRDFHNLFGDARCVTTFALENGVPSYHTPLFTNGKLKSIQIEEPHLFSYSTPIERILDILAANPDLHAFLLAGNKSGPEEAVRANRRIIPLASLRVLSLQSVDIPTILDHISCPLLEKVKLGNELGAVWGGSTATSLRNMIKRSKNFRVTRLRINEIATPNAGAANEWACFDVMPNLTSFRCHHSPFPDDILASLSRYPVPNVPKDGTANLNDEQIICPRLSKLVFENCEFSGEALIELVVSRMRRAMEYRDVAVLQELWVGQCPGLTQQHLTVLSGIMGSRFQATLLPEI